MTLEEMRAGVAYVEALLADIHARNADTVLDGDDRAAWDDGVAYVEATRAAIADVEARQRIFERGQVHGQPGDAGARDGAFQIMRKTETRVDMARASRAEVRDAALAVLERDGSDLADHQLRHAEQLIRRSDATVARRMLLTENDGYRSAWMKVMTGAVAFTPDEVRALDEYREMNILTDGDGGYGVPVLIDPTIILTDQESTNPFAATGTTTKTITTDSWKGVSAPGVTWAFETESAAANDISPTLSQPAITVHKAQGFIPYTIEVGMDYPDFAAEMSRLLGAGYTELLVDKFTRGSGSTEPWGIFSAIDQTAGSEVAVTSDGNLLAADIYKVWKSLPQKYRRNASWLMNIDVENEIRSLGDDKLHQQTVNLAAGSIGPLMGKPVFESPYAPEFSGTTGAANILVVGDFSNFYVVNRAGMSVEFVPHVFDTTTGTPKGQRGWYAWARVGADSVNDAAFRLLQNT